MPLLKRIALRLRNLLLHCGETYSGLQYYVSSVGAILVIAHTPKAKTSLAPTETGVPFRQSRLTFIFHVYFGAP